MKISGYWVFGAGSAWVEWSGPAEVIVQFLAELDPSSIEDDGDNGFIGYMSVPDEIKPEGVETRACAYPPGVQECAGFRRRRQVRREYAEQRFRADALFADALALAFSSRELHGAESLVDLFRDLPDMTKYWETRILAFGAGVRGIALPAGAGPRSGANYNYEAWEAALQMCYSRGENPLPRLRQEYPNTTFRFLRPDEEPTSMKPGWKVYALLAPGERVLVGER